MDKKNNNKIHKYVIFAVVFVVNIFFFALIPPYIFGNVMIIQIITGILLSIILAYYITGIISIIILYISRKSI